jgi:hypothetical protein
MGDSFKKKAALAREAAFKKLSVVSCQWSANTQDDDMFVFPTAERGLLTALSN